MNLIFPVVLLSKISLYRTQRNKPDHLLKGSSSKTTHPLFTVKLLFLPNIQILNTLKNYMPPNLHLHSNQKGVCLNKMEDAGGGV